MNNLRESAAPDMPARRGSRYKQRLQLPIQRANVRKDAAPARTASRDL